MVNILSVELDESLDEAGFRHVATSVGLRLGAQRIGASVYHLRPSGSVVELFRSGSVASVTVVGPRAFVTFFGTKPKAAVIELGTGRVVRHAVPARPLVGAGQPIVG